jgi:ABC-type amino acid transport substrate-binding protein
MKLLLTTIAAVLVVGCGTTQQSAPTLVEVKPAELVAEASQPEPSTQKELHKKSCYNQLKQIDGGKEMWAVQERRADGDTPSDSQLGAYFKDGMPSCPGGGAYTIGAVANPATCSIHSKPARPAIQTRGKKPAVSRNIPVRRTKVTKAPTRRRTGVKHSEADDALISAAVHRNIKAPAISMHEAAARGNIEAVKQHLAAGVDVNAPDVIKRTPLHNAAEYGRKEIAELLIAEGADVNAKDKPGFTPLHVAALPGEEEVAELLIAEGANVNAKDIGGNTPLDWAIRRKHTATADLLREHGGKTSEELKVIVESYEVLRVSCGPRGNTYMPFTSWQVGGKEPIGYDPDLIKLIAKEIGVVVKFIDAQSLFNKWRETAVDPRLSVLSEDIADVSLYAITINNERKKQVDFSEPYFTDGLSILVKRESGILSLNELKGKKILAPSNTVAYPWTKKNLTQSIIVSEITNFIPNDLILKGTVDAYIADRVNLLAISSKDNRLVVLPRRLTTDHLGIAVKKGNTELLGKINAALIKFKENGALKELEAKWF